MGEDGTLATGWGCNRRRHATGNDPAGEREVIYTLNVVRVVVRDEERIEHCRCHAERCESHRCRAAGVELQYQVARLHQPARARAFRVWGRETSSGERDGCGHRIPRIERCVPGR